VLVGAVESAGEATRAGEPQISFHIDFNFCYRFGIYRFGIRLYFWTDREKETCQTNVHKVVQADLELRCP